MESYGTSSHLLNDNNNNANNNNKNNKNNVNDNANDNNNQNNKIIFKINNNNAITLHNSIIMI